MSQPTGLLQAADVVEVKPRGRQEIVACVVLEFEDPADEREAVRVDPVGWEADDDVALRNLGAVDEAVAVDEADAGAGEVELAVSVDPGQLVIGRIVRA